MTTAAAHSEPSPDRLLTAAEAAEILAVPESWVREHARQGRLPHLQLGHYVRFKRQSLLAWIDAEETTTPTRRRRRTPT